MDEPDVTHFNSQLYVLFWMTRACAEYVVHLSQSRGAIDLDLVPEFVQACERNIDLSYVIHFLYDFAFLVVDFKQAVRANDSKRLDLLWREFYASGRTATANKTQYVPMSIMRVFWAEALDPVLAGIYHAMRAIPMSERTYVGWDSPIEWLNGAISQGVSRLVSEQRIERFISHFSLLDANYRHLQESTHCEVRSGMGMMKEMDCNVNCMKRWLMDKVGADWSVATRVNVDSKLDLGRGTAPWLEVRNAMSQVGRDSVAAHVAKSVRALTDTFFAFDD